MFADDPNDPNFSWAQYYRERSGNKKRTLKQSDIIAMHAADAAVDQTPISEGKTCPKCGKPLHARGAHFHIQACRGIDDAS